MITQGMRDFISRASPLVPPLAVIVGANWAPIYVLLVAALAADIARPRQVRATSWWRTRKHNAEVGGSPGSQHLIGAAMDLVGVYVAEVEEASRQLGIDVTVVDEGDHVHIQQWPAGEAAALVARLAR